tara:strand:- start:34707 stop:34979 length:273 start_codon:yes stop_codon:yes gene_type:complete
MIRRIISNFLFPSEETIERIALTHFRHLLGLPEGSLSEAGIYVDNSPLGFYDTQLPQYGLRPSTIITYMFDFPPISLVVDFDRVEPPWRR